MMAVFAYGANSFNLAGNNAAGSISGVLEQNGKILRTITGLGVRNLVWSKWAYSFAWSQSPEEVATKLLAMKAYDGTITFTDSTIGNFTFVLTDDALVVEKTAFGIVTATATFKEA